MASHSAISPANFSCARCCELILMLRVKPRVTMLRMMRTHVSCCELSLPVKLRMMLRMMLHAMPRMMLRDVAHGRVTLCHLSCPVCRAQLLTTSVAHMCTQSSCARPLAPLLRLQVATFELEMRERTSRATFALNSSHLRAGATQRHFARLFCTCKFGFAAGAAE